jgi:hypothetical protein
MFCGTCLARHWQTSRRRDREEHHGREVAPCPVCRVRSEAVCARVCGLPLNDGLLVQASPCLSFTLLSLISPVTALPTCTIQHRTRTADATA